jgi:DNA-binding transcriptional LysR family regulator
LILLKYQDYLNSLNTNGADMELRHLKYFTVLAEELHFRRAAERLGIAQPPLSKQIRDLELELEVKLFERNQQRVLLTKAGKVFLKEVRLIMSQVDIAVTKVQQVHRGGAVKISIGFSAPAQQVLIKVLTTLKNLTPEVTISLQEISGLEQLAALRNNRIDLALGYLPDSNLLQRDGLENKAIQSEKFYLAISEQQNQPPTQKFDHLGLSAIDLQQQVQESGKSTKDSDLMLSINILNTNTLILAKEQWGDFAEIRLLEVLHQMNIKPAHIQEVTKMETALSLVAQNLGITIINSAFYGFQKTGVLYVGLQESLTRKDIGMIWRKDNSLESLEKIVSSIESEILEKV